MLIGDNSARHVIVDFAHNIEAQGKMARNLLSNMNLFGDMSDKLYIKRMKSIREVMHGNEIKDKAVRKFNNVEELEDFTENAKLLARKAPGTIKFLIGKSPIFIVGGLALSEGETMSEKMHSLWQGMMGLVPFVGPMLILRDGMRAGEKQNFGEAAVGAALIGVDTVHLIKAARSSQRATELIHMFTRPVIDMVEIGRFVGQTTKNSYKMVRDGVKLAREGKMAGLGEKILASVRETPSKKRAVMAAVAALASRGIYELMPEGMDKEAEVLFTKYKNDPNGLDKALAENWHTFDQDTKNDCIKYALMARLSLRPEDADNMKVEYTNGTYVIGVPVMIEKQQGNAILAAFKDNIARVEPDAKIEMEVSGLVAYNFRKNLAEKLKNEGVKPEEIERTVEEHVIALGYDAGIGKETNT
ncbi:hypothetical protein KBC03_01660 [Patescibacteria group bacterium]|nr:hypothetical protein [Patescibacteria group bacterium]